MPIVGYGGSAFSRDAPEALFDWIKAQTGFAGRDVVVSCTPLATTEVDDGQTFSRQEFTIEEWLPIETGGYREAGEDAREQFTIEALTNWNYTP